jgi:hypothetical protein
MARISIAEMARRLGVGTSAIVMHRVNRDKGFPFPLTQISSNFGKKDNPGLFSMQETWE